MNFFLLSLACLSVVVAVWFSQSFSYLPPMASCDGQLSTVRVFTSESIRQYNVSSFMKPLLLVILGDVFDVSDGGRFYGEGEGYHTFVGQDNSRAFFSGEFDRVRPDVLDLETSQIEGIVNWNAFYHKHDTYSYVGVLQGLYYDCKGAPTNYRQSVLAKSKGLTEVSEGTQLERCAVDGSETFSTLKCSVGFPRRIDTGGCACILDAAASSVHSNVVTPYPGCSADSNECVLYF